jgi:hypothetical protein
LPKGNSEGFRAANKFKVPLKQWGSWTLVARHTFNKLYESMTMNPDLFLSTKVRETGGLPMDEKDWKVTAWNAAWTAASVVSRGERHILADLSNKMKGK